VKLPQPCPRCKAEIMNYTARCGSCSYGAPVMVFDPRLFKNDLDTPLSITVQRAVVVNDRTDEHSRRLLDVRFDYRPDEISHGHFADRVKWL
jgi:hypothetical protein